MVDYLYHTRRCESRHIPWTILPLTVIFFYLRSQFVCPDYLLTTQTQTCCHEYPMIVIFSPSTIILTFLLLSYHTTYQWDTAFFPHIVCILYALYLLVLSCRMFLPLTTIRLFFRYSAEREMICCY